MNHLLIVLRSLVHLVSFLPYFLLFTFWVTFFWPVTHFSPLFCGFIAEHLFPFSPPPLHPRSVFLQKALGKSILDLYVPIPSPYRDFLSSPFFFLNFSSTRFLKILLTREHCVESTFAIGPPSPPEIADPTVFKTRRSSPSFHTPTFPPRRLCERGSFRANTGVNVFVFFLSPPMSRKSLPKVWNFLRSLIASVPDAVF